MYSDFNKDLTNNLLNKFMKNTKDLIAILQIDGTIIFSNPSFSSLYKDDENIIGLNLFTLNEKYGHDDHSWFHYTIENLSYSFKINSKDGFNITTSWNNEVLFDEEGHAKYVVCYGHDVSEIVSLSKTFEYSSTHDSITGLLNFNGLIKTIKDFEKVNKAICYYINVSSFSSIVNYYGVDIGLLILQKIASNLKAYPNSVASRISGDAFILILINPSDEEVNSAYSKMKKAILKFHEIETKIVQVKKNISYAVYPDDSTDFTKLINLASLANAKSLNPNSISKYHGFMSDIITNNISVALKLQNAIKEEKIEIYFQKIIDSDSCVYKYVEALARWKDDELGSVRPDYFIKIAKESHLLDYLDDYLVKKTIEEFSKLRKISLYSSTLLSLNISPSAVFRPEYASFIERIVKEYNLKNEDIIIEISEYSFVNNISLCRFYINELKEKGFKIAIDDFGREYSSLSILEEIDYDIIKIDGGFVKNISSAKNLTIIEMIIKIALLYEKEIIAEGVETEQISETLKKLSCFVHQGYYYHRPSKINI